MVVCINVMPMHQTENRAATFLLIILKFVYRSLFIYLFIMLDRRMKW